MKHSGVFAVLCIFFVTACTRPTNSSIVAAFDPVPLLNKVGRPEGITYRGGSATTSSSGGVFSGATIEKSWRFSFDGSNAQLSTQLESLRAELETHLTSAGCTISGRGLWYGDFSGLSFKYSAGGRKGFMRVTAVSFGPRNQGLEIVIYEH